MSSGMTKRSLVATVSGAILVTATLMGAQSVPTTPTFVGYRWPAGVQETYQAHLTAQVSGSLTAPAATPIHGTLTWNPVVTLITGTAGANGLPITLRYQSAPMAESVTASGLGLSITRSMATSLSVSGMLQPNGNLMVTSFPADPSLLPVLTVMPIPLLPAVPRAGWTSGHSFLSPVLSPAVSVMLTSESLDGLQVSKGLGQMNNWITPRVGNHHWTVTTIAKANHPITLKDGTADSVTLTHFGWTNAVVLNGQKGGLYVDQAVAGHVTAEGAWTFSTAMAGMPAGTYKGTLHLGFHWNVSPT